MSNPSLISPTLNPEDRAAAFGRHLAVVVLLIGLGATSLVWWKTEKLEERYLMEQLAISAGEVVERIRTRILENEMMLRGANGMITAMNRLPTRKEWHDYVESLNLRQQAPGVQGVGLSLLISPAEKDAHETAVRAEGFIHYRITPESERDVYTAILYLEPLDERNHRALGYDMFSESVRRDAMIKARDTGQAATSGIVRLKQENGQNVQPGFLLYLPLYKPGRDSHSLEERRSALLCYIYSPLRAHDFFLGIFGNEFAKQVAFDLEVFDSESIDDPSRRFYSSRLDGSGAALELTRQVNLRGRTWTLQFRSRPAFDKTFRSHTSKLIAACGLLLSFMMFGLLWFGSRQRERIATRVRMITRELGENRSMLEAITESAHDAIFSAGPDGRVTYMNPAALGMFALSAEDQPGRLLSDLLVNTKNPAALGAEFSGNGITECSGMRSDGSLFPVELSIAVWPTADGNALNAIVRDISERKFAESRMEAENRIALTLAESGPLDAKLAEFLRTLATIYSWDCSAFWQISGDRTHLQCTAAWTGNNEELNTFYAEVTSMPAGTGSGNAGVARRAWETDAPCWIPDVQSCGGTLRAAAFTRAGICCGIAFPINAGKEKIGVVELFSRQPLQLKDSLLSV